MEVHAMKIRSETVIKNTVQRKYPYLAYYESDPTLVYLFIAKYKGICVSSLHSPDILVDGVEHMPDEDEHVLFSGSVTITIDQ